jgi:hypothetical protein
MGGGLGQVMQMAQKAPSNPLSQGGAKAPLIAQSVIDSLPGRTPTPNLAVSPSVNVGPAVRQFAKDNRGSLNDINKNLLERNSDTLGAIGAMAGGAGSAGAPQQAQERMAMPQGMMQQMPQNQNSQLMAIMQQMMAARQGQQYQPRAMLGNSDMLRHLRGR